MDGTRGGAAISETKCHRPARALPWADSERVGFTLRNLVDALAPSNKPVLNPPAVKAAIDTGGESRSMSATTPSAVCAAAR